MTQYAFVAAPRLFDSRRKNRRNPCFAVGLAPSPREKRAGYTDSDRAWWESQSNLGTRTYETAEGNADMRDRWTVPASEHRERVAADRRYRSIDRMADLAAEDAAAMDRHESGVF